MKVAVVGMHIEISVSGEAESQRNLVQALRRAGVDADLIQNADLAELDVHPDANERVGSKLGNLLSLPKAVAARCSSYDLIHLNLPTPAFGFIAEKLAATTQVPVVVHFDSQLIDQSFLQMLQLCAKDPRFFLPRLLINNSLWARRRARSVRGVIVSSEYQRQQLCRAGYMSQAVDVIPNLTRTEYLQPGVSRREAWKLPGQGVLAYAGHLFRVKGTETLLAAFAASRLAQRLIIAESGLGNKEALIASAKKLGIYERLQFAGHVVMPDFFASVDCMLLPYLAGYGTVVYPNLVLEAMAAGVPLITSATGPLQEIDQRCLLSVKSTDPAAYAAAIDNLLQDPTRQKCMIAAQRNLMNTDLHPDTLCRKFIAVYSRILHG